MRKLSTVSNPAKCFSGIILLCLLLLSGCGIKKVSNKGASRTAHPVSTHSQEQLYHPSVNSDGAGLEVVMNFAPLEGTDLEELFSSKEYGLVENDLAFEGRLGTVSGDVLAGLLPKEGVELGQAWTIEPSVVEGLLSLLHSNVHADLNIDGAGSVAVLRAVSEDFFEVDFRLHAQFLYGEYIWVTPAQFDGVAIVERENKRIRFLKVEVPTEHYRNIAFEIHGGDWRTGLGFSPQLGMEGGESTNIDWSQELTLEDVRSKLSEQLLSFTRTEWLPLSEALRKGEDLGRPILAIVLEGALTDQSC